MANLEDFDRAKRSVGPTIGLVIILIVIIIGGLYFWTNRTSENGVYNQNRTGETSQTNNGTVDTSIGNLQRQSISDETGSIEDDLNATDIDGIDTEVL